MSPGKRPVCIFYRRHRHGLPRGGRAQAGTHHRLPLHRRSVPELSPAFSTRRKQAHKPFSVLLFNLIPFAFSLNSFCFILHLFSFSPLRPLSCISRTNTLSCHAPVSPPHLIIFLSLLIRRSSFQHYWFFSFPFTLRPSQGALRAFHLSSYSSSFCPYPHSECISFSSLFPTSLSNWAIVFFLFSFFWVGASLTQSFVSFEC